MRARLYELNINSIVDGKIEFLSLNDFTKKKKKRESIQYDED
jgi:hypothetical protein